MTYLMTYPILPLTPAWGNSEQEQADIAKTKYGEAGVEQRDFIGINPLSASRDINVNIRNFQEVDAFLRSRRGQPFRLSLDGGVSDDGKFYTCTEWQIQQLGVGAGNFSAKLTQMRRLPSPGEIIVPPAPEQDPYFDDVVALLHYDSLPFLDVKGHIITPAGNGNPILSDTGVFGKGIRFNGSNCLQILSSDFIFEGDFTFETRMYWLGNTAHIFTAGISLSYQNTGFLITEDGALYVGYFMVGTLLFTGAVVPVREWVSIAFCRKNNTLSAFVNGVLVASSSNGLVIGNDEGFTIGGFSPYNYINAYFDETRITRRGRYSADYIISNLPFPDN